MGIGETIIEDHDEFRKTLAQIEKTSVEDANLRKQMLPHFIRMLYAHHVAEEETLFLAMEKKEKLKTMSLDMTEEHRAMMILLNDLELSGWDFKYWAHRFRPFREIFVVHLNKEEKALIPHLRSYFSQAEIDELSKGFDEVRSRELGAR
jgi:hemerythrin-like domain-containing protein